MHLSIESFLNGCVMHEDEVAELKVIAAHGVGMFQLKSDSGFDTRFINLVMKVSEV